MGLDDREHALCAERPDQLGFQIGIAHVEAELLHPGAIEVRAEAGTLEPALELALLARVAEPRKPETAKTFEETADRLRAAHRHDRDALAGEMAAAALGERLQRDLVAGSFDQDDPGDIDH